MNKFKIDWDQVDIVDVICGLIMGAAVFILAIALVWALSVVALTMGIVPCILSAVAVVVFVYLSIWFGQNYL